MYIYLNGKILDSEAAHLSPWSQAFLYGYGLFETIKVVNGRLYFLQEHIKRIQKGCDVLKLKFMYSKDIIEKFCNGLIQKNGLKNGAIRMSYSRGVDENLLLISTRQNIYTEDSYTEGFKLCFAHIKRNPYSPIVYLKSNNYLENLLARKEAEDRGFNEAVFLNIYEKVCEGTISNIFFIKDNKIFTPAIDCGVLSGILRNKVIGIIGDLGLKLHIGEYEKNFMYDADEIFITNSLMDIMPVSRLENRKYDMKNNNVTRTLMKEIKKLYR